MVDYCDLGTLAKARSISRELKARVDWCIPRIHPNCFIRDDPRYYANALDDCIVKVSRRSHGPRAGQLDMSLVHKKRVGLAQFLTPFHVQEMPRGPPFGNVDVFKAFEHVRNAGPLASAQIVLSLTTRGLPRFASADGSDADCTHLIRAWMPKLCRKFAEAIFEHNAAGAESVDAMTQRLYASVVQRRRGTTIDRVVMSTRVAEPIYDRHVRRVTAMPADTDPRVFALAMAGWRLRPYPVEGLSHRPSFTRDIAKGDITSDGFIPHLTYDPSDPLRMRLRLECVGSFKLT